MTNTNIDLIDEIDEKAAEWEGSQRTELRETDRNKWWNRLAVDHRYFPYEECSDLNSPPIPIIDLFRGEHWFLSNFCHTDFISVEHYYQAAKVKDQEEFFPWKGKILMANTPGKARRLGREKDLPLREDWDKVKENIMYSLLLRKYRHPHFRNKLLATGNAYLIEGTVWHDSFWGICINKECNRGCRELTGLNRLGVLLMQIRSIIRAQGDC